MNSNLELKRTWIPPGKQAQYSLTIPLSPGELSCICDSILRTVVASLGISKQSITDIKGSDPGLIKTMLPNSIPPLTDELLRIEGSVDYCEPEDFLVTLETAFKSFVGSHHITHSIKETRSGDQLDGLELRDIGRALPITLDRVRVACDLFTSSFAFASLGYAPVVSSSILLDAVKDQLKLFLLIDGIGAGTPKLFSSDLFRAIEGVLVSQKKLSIQADFDRLLALK